MNLEQLNTAGRRDAASFFEQCCSCDTWIDRMCDGRPYATRQGVFDAADANWKNLSEGDYLRAFSAHPRIGDLDSLRKRYCVSGTLSAGEQRSVRRSSDRTLEGLAAANQRYEEKNGFIFIVCATGKSATEMLALLESRLSNDRATEIANAAEEQRRITRIRLEKLL